MIIPDNLLFPSNTEPSTNAIPHTDEMTAVIEKMIDTPAKYTLDAVLARTKNPLGKNAPDGGYITFIAQSLPKFSSANDRLLTFWNTKEENDSSFGANPFGLQPSYPENIICRTSPLLASLMTGRFDLCKKCLHTEGFDHIKKDDLSITRFFDDRNYPPDTGNTFTMGRPQRYRDYTVLLVPLIQRLSYAILTHPDMPDSIRVEMLTRLREDFPEAYNNRPTIDTFNFIGDKIFMEQTYAPASDEADWCYWPSYEDDSLPYHIRAKQLCRALTTLKMLKTKAPDILTDIISINIYLEIILTYFRLFISPAKNEESDSFLMPAEPAPRNTMVKRLRALCPQAIPEVSPLIWNKLIRNDDSNRILNYTKYLKDTMECEHFREFYKATTSSTLVINCRQEEIRSRFYNYCEFASANFAFEDQNFRNLLTLCDKVVLATSSAPGDICKKIIEAKNADLLIVALEKDLIRSSDTSKLIKHAKSVHANRLIPLLILKHNGQWE